MQKKSSDSQLLGKCNKQKDRRKYSDEDQEEHPSGPSPKASESNFYYICSVEVLILTNKGHVAIGHVFGPKSYASKHTFDNKEFLGIPGTIFMISVTNCIG